MRLRGFGRPLVALIGLSVGALCLWLAMRGVDWRDVERIFRAVDPALIGRDSAEGEALLEVIDWVRSQPGGSPTLGQLTAHFDGSAISAAIESALQEIGRAHV